ncbi:MAG: ABC transporter permease [Thermomicrobiales bacterium]|nr:ABC transporter permease [Thermomicrobiales bacterium]
MASVAPAHEKPGRAWRQDPSAAVGVLLLAPALVLLLLFFVVPILRIFWVALSEPTFSLDNFSAFFNSPAARRSLLTTLRVSAVVTVLATLIGLVVAWELRTTTSKWKRAALWLATLFPLWTSVVVRNYAFTILLQRKGILNTALISTGVIGEPLDILYTDVAVVLGMLYTMLPYAILPIYASLINLDTAIVSAAESLGASRPRAVRDVVLPLIAPSVFAAAAITFVVSVGFYITPILLGGPESPFLATFIDQQLFSLYNFPAAAATASVLFLTAAIVVGFAWRTVGFEQIRRALS